MPALHFHTYAMSVCEKKSKTHIAWSRSKHPWTGAAPVTICKLSFWPPAIPYVRVPGKNPHRTEERKLQDAEKKLLLALTACTAYNRAQHSQGLPTVNKTHGFPAAYGAPENQIRLPPFHHRTIFEASELLRAITVSSFVLQNHQLHCQLFQICNLLWLIVCREIWLSTQV